MRDRRAKGIDIWDSLVVLLQNIRYPWPCSVQCNFELFVALPIFLQIISPKKNPTTSSIQIVAAIYQTSTGLSL